MTSVVEISDYAGHDDYVPAGRLEPDPYHAVGFLRWLRPGGPWVVTAIRKEGRSEIQTRTFTSEPDLAAWIERLNTGSIGGASGYSIYYHVNPTIRPLDKKAQRKDIAALEFAHVDIDPRAGEDLLSEQQRALDLLTTSLPDRVPPPTVIIFSGGGYQALWRLAKPIPIDGDLERAEEAKSWNIELESVLDADRCHNVDRLLRLPGTINWPDGKKRARGRVPEFAYVERIDHGLAYELDDLPSRARKQPAAVGAVTTRPALVGTRLRQAEELDEWGVSDRTKMIVVQGRDPEPSEHQKSFTRSEWLYSVVNEFVRRAVPDDVIYGVITDSNFGISESVLDHSNPHTYAERQIARAHEARGEFDRSGKNGAGPPVATYLNARRAILRLGIDCQHDLFRDRMIVGGHDLQHYQGDISDNACSMLRQVIIDQFGFDPTKTHPRDAVQQLCLENGYDPVCDYLDGLEWDGVERLDHWMTTYLGASDCEYVRAVGRITLIAAVRRARRPGVKFDSIIVWEGPQGVGKSQAVAALAGHPEFFSDEPILGLKSREVAEAVEGVWFYELGELESITKSDINRVKAFASRTHDRARKAYAHFKDNQPRRCIFVATTNEDGYLRDTTGNRRFLPVRTTSVDLDALRRDRDQLMAEAAHREAQGESITLHPSLWEAAAHEQREREAPDPWADILAAAEGELDAAGFESIFSRTLLGEVLEIPKDRQGAGHTRRLAAIMRRLGWEGPLNMTIGGRRGKGFRRCPTAAVAAPSDEDLPF